MKFINQTMGFLVLALCWASISYAHAGEDGMDPRAVVEQAANQVITVLEKEGDVVRNDPDKIYVLVNQHILPHFDFNRMSYFVLGKTWKQASDEQKAGFLQQFKHLLITTYSTALAGFSTDEEIIYKETKYSPTNENIAIVSTMIGQKGAGLVAVAYRMYRSEDRWRIYDVVIGGVSLVTNYRANFASQVRSKGLDGLIASLSEHNQPRTKDALVQKASHQQ